MQPAGLMGCRKCVYELKRLGQTPEGGMADVANEEKGPLESAVAWLRSATEFVGEGTSSSRYGAIDLELRIQACDAQHLRSRKRAAVQPIEATGPAGLGDCAAHPWHCAERPSRNGHGPPASACAASACFLSRRTARSYFSYVDDGMLEPATRRLSDAQEPTGAPCGGALPPRVVTACVEASEAGGALPLHSFTQMALAVMLPPRGRLCVLRLRMKACGRCVRTGARAEVRARLRARLHALACVFASSCAFTLGRACARARARARARA
eukprot:6180146-Pleurochrysis_carterae.AAC.1